MTTGALRNGDVEVFLLMTTGSLRLRLGDQGSLKGSSKLCSSRGLGGFRASGVQGGFWVV